jgi:hypothetical protein
MSVKNKVVFTDENRLIQVFAHKTDDLFLIEVLLLGEVSWGFNRFFSTLYPLSFRKPTKSA